MSKKVLIVDDNIELHNAFIEIVKGGGYDVCAAEDGQVACAMFNNHKSDLVLSDLKMPYMNGFELLAHIKSLSQ